MTTIEQLEQAKNQAYAERNQLVAALSKVFPAHLQKHDESDAAWERDWLNIVCIHIPTSHTIYMPGLPVAHDVETVTWHIHDSDLPMFRHLKVEPNHWDGHTTDEKYERLARLTRGR